jgi:hypothetical protein
MRGLLFICNTPFAAMASRVLHRPIESAVESGLRTVRAQRLLNFAHRTLLRRLGALSTAAPMECHSAAAVV